MCIRDRDYTVSRVDAAGYMPFSLLMLIPFICFMYGIYLSTFGLLGGKKNVKTGLILVVLGIAGLAGGYFVDIKPIDVYKRQPYGANYHHAYGW